MKFGVNTWVWVSPLTDKDLEWLVPHIAELGFDWIELPLEQTDTLDYQKAARLIKKHNLGVSVCAAISRRPRFHPSRSECPAECNCLCEALHRCALSSWAATR